MNYTNSFSHGMICYMFLFQDFPKLVFDHPIGSGGGRRGTYWHWLITPEIAGTVIALPLWYPDQKNDHDTFNLVPSLVPKETDWTSRAGLIRWVGKGWQWWNIFFRKTHLAVGTKNFRRFRLKRRRSGSEGWRGSRFLSHCLEDFMLCKNNVLYI